MRILDSSSITKFERIQVLRAHGINVPDYQLIEMGTPRSLVLARFPHHKRVSVRTQSPLGGMDASLPKLINASPAAAKTMVLKWLDTYDILVSKAIDPDKCLHCANIALFEDKIVIEIVEGAGVLDRLTRNGRIDRRIHTTRPSIRSDLDRDPLLPVVRAVSQLPYQNVIVETSSYSIKVGILSRNYIAWEITNW